MIKHKILYIPEGRYLHFCSMKNKYNDNIRTEYIEDARFYHRVKLVSDRRERISLAKAKKCIVSWNDRPDDFFEKNDIPTKHILEEELEITEEIVEESN